MTTKKCPRCGEVLHWCHDDMYLCNKCNTVCGYEEKVKPKCLVCGKELDAGIIENECYVSGPGEGCEECPHYECCLKGADE